MTTGWDLVVVGAGPAGAATAIGALRQEPGLRVAMLDRADFPRDKACGDGVAPHVVDLLEEVGVAGIVAGCRPVPRLRLSRGGLAADREMARPAWVVPRTVLDQRLVTAAQEAGAALLKHRARTVERHDGVVLVDDRHAASVVVGADGAQSLVRRVVAAAKAPMAIALRGYAPTPPARAGVQVLAFGTDRLPSYAWSFDRGDGLANVGYGELVAGHRAGPTRAEMLDRLDALLPGAATDGRDWRGARLPLSSWRWRPSRGPILLAGDAAALVHPMTGEGIYYAVATGLAAGRAAAAAISEGSPDDAGDRYRTTTRALLDRHLRHSAVAARLCRRGAIIDAGLRASATDQRVFDDLVELGLAQGGITAAMSRGLVRALVTRRRTTTTASGRTES